MNMMHIEAEAKAFIPAENDRSIGAILVEAGRLTPADADKVLRRQKERGLRFGDAARQLGLLSDDDIRFALSQQFDYPYVTSSDSRVSKEVVAAYNPFSPQVEALRALRSQLMLRWFASEVAHRVLAVVSPERGEGRSWLAANLAVVCSQLGERTLLIDADLRSPRQHQMFGIENRYGLSAVLAGRGSPECVQRVPTLSDLSVLPAGVTPPNPQELLARPMFTSLLRQMSERYDVLIIDTPGGGEFADGQTIAARAAGALMVARLNRSTPESLRAYAESINRTGATVVGSVLNEY